MRGHCNMCEWLIEERTLKLLNGDIYHLKFSANCETKGVIYILFCVCRVFYIGKTKRQLKLRLSEHAYDIKVGRLNLPTCWTVS